MLINEKKNNYEKIEENVDYKELQVNTVPVFHVINGKTRSRIDLAGMAEIELSILKSARNFPNPVCISSQDNQTHTCRYM